LQDSRALAPASMAGLRHKVRHKITAQVPMVRSGWGKKI
jgi:hypothetical protein